MTTEITVADDDDELDRILAEEKLQPPNTHLGDRLRELEEARDARERAAAERSESEDDELARAIAEGIPAHPDWKDALRRHREQQNNEQTPQPEHDADLIPDLTSERSLVDERLQRFVEEIGIIEAYLKWGGKGFVPEPRGRTEGIKVRCPDPDHVDENPSAWLSTRENAWYCGRCCIGGGPLQLAGLYYGHTDGKTRGRDFIDLREQAAADFGWTPATGQAAAPLMSSADAEGTTPTPQTVVSAHARPGKPTMTDAALHGLAGECVRAIEPHTEAEPAAILVQLLVAFGNALGRTAHFLVGNTPHYTNLFAVLVGATSKARKGTSWSTVAALMSHADPDWLDRCVMEGLVSGEGLVHHIRDARYVIKRGSASKDDEDDSLVKEEVDCGVFDKRMLCKEEEFASVLRAANRKESTVSMRIRQLWDTGSVRTLSKNNPDRATNAHVSIIGHITFDELLRTLNATDATNGLANRMLWCGIHRAKLLARPRALPAVDSTRLGDALAGALDFGRSMNAMDFDDEADALWRDVYEEISRDETGLLAAVTDRAEAQVIRLALIYAILDRSEVVGVVHLRAAIAFWQYSFASARWIFGDSTGDNHSDRILDALRAAGSAGLTRTEIQKNVFNNHADKAKVDAALKLLRSASLASVKIESTGGAPSERWRATTAK